MKKTKAKSKKLIWVLFLLAFFQLVLFKSVSAEEETNIWRTDLKSNEKIPLPKVESNPLNISPEIKTENQSISGKSCTNQKGDSDIDCADYCKSQSVQIKFTNNKEIYSPNEVVELSGELINDNTYPIVEGTVFARITRKNNEHPEEGNYIIDEFIVKDNISLKEKETQTINFKWTIPEGITTGNYKVEFIFSVGKQFILAGTPFYNEISMGGINFGIKSDQKSFLSFDRSKTTVNGEKYKHFGNWLTIETNKEALIKQSIQSTLNEERNVDITYNLYRWNSLNNSDLLDTKKESITLGSQTDKELEYKIPQLTEAVYYLQIVAQSKSDKSIVYIRITTPQTNIKLDYLAVTRFPIKQGEGFSLFSCFHDEAATASKGKIEVILTDKKNNEVGRFDQEGLITNKMAAQKADITAQKDYDYLKLTAKVYDEKNNLKDQYETIYDCKNFNSCKDSGIAQLSSLPNDFAKALGLIFVIIAISAIGVVAGNTLSKKK